MRRLILLSARLTAAAASVVFVVVALLGTVHTGSYAATLRSMPIAAMSCIGCDECSTTSEHRTYSTGYRQVSAGEHGSCWPYGDCDLQHPRCQEELELEELQEIWSTAQRAEGVGLQQLVKRYGEARVAINLSREAVQVFGCGKQIVAHIPLTDRQVASLTQ